MSPEATDAYVKAESRNGPGWSGRPASRRSDARGDITLARCRSSGCSGYNPGAGGRHLVQLPPKRIELGKLRQPLNSTRVPDPEGAVRAAGRWLRLVLMQVWCWTVPPERASYNGITPASQAGDEGSTPFARSTVIPHSGPRGCDGANPASWLRLDQRAGRRAPLQGWLRRPRRDGPSQGDRARTLRSPVTST